MAKTPTAKDLTLLRTDYLAGRRTLGSLYRTPVYPMDPTNPDPAAWICYTMEPQYDPLRASTRGSDTAIPAGLYRYTIETHPRHPSGPILRYWDVPGRVGILLHPGTKDADTLGCILPGVALAGPNGDQVVAGSRAARDKIISYAGKVGDWGWIQIIDGGQKT